MIPTLNRSVALADLGAAYASLGDVEHACSLLQRALDLADQAGLAYAIQRVHGIRAQHLVEYETEPPVRQLDERLQLVA